MSKEELIHENDQLVAEVSRLKVGLDEVQEQLHNLEKAFVQSKASFSLARYGELKDMIKKVTSEEMLKKVHSLTENQANPASKKGTTGLLEKARTFGADDGATAAAADKNYNKPTSPKSRSGLSGFFKKIKDITGFSDDAPDIRCLDKDDIRKDNQRKIREIQRLNTRGLRAHEKFSQLKKRYEASKSHAPPTRYQELKEMIKDVISSQTI